MPRFMDAPPQAYHCILKLARTIADLVGSDRIETVHLACPLLRVLRKAIEYRPRWLS
jgi:predicted ATPase with chaperone activity